MAQLISFSIKSDLTFLTKNKPVNLANNIIVGPLRSNLLPSIPLRLELPVVTDYSESDKAEVSTEMARQVQMSRYRQIS